MTEIKLFSGNANHTLSANIAKQLQLSLGKALVNQFKDDETRIEIQEDIRGKTVFIIQSTAYPTNHHVMELLLMADALRRAAAKRIVAVIPYFGYARQDKRKNGITAPISAKVIADLLTTVGIDEVLSIDIHADQIQGFFSIPFNNIQGIALFLEDITQGIRTAHYQNPVIVSPDVGGVERARAYAKRLNTDLVIIDKRRPHPNQAQVMNIIGDINNRQCILVDDMVDTGETLCFAAKALKERGATQVVAYATHAVLSGNAIQTIQSSLLDELIVTDTISLTSAARTCPLIRQLSTATLLATAIQKS